MKLSIHEKVFKLSNFSLSPNIIPYIVNCSKSKNLAVSLTLEYDTNMILERLNIKPSINAIYTDMQSTDKRLMTFLETYRKRLY